MVSKNQIKLITSLQQKKFRVSNGLFLAEGEKTIGELLTSCYELEHLYVTENIFAEVTEESRIFITDSDLMKISALKSHNNCLALFKIPQPKKIKESGLIAALDDIRDPGNLGTLVRLCDWFGITQLVCSEETADLYNPKTVQASMGSIARVSVNFTNLNAFLQATSLQVFGTFMDGRNIYEAELPLEGIVVFGNEANGISKTIEALIKNRLSIPRFGDIQKTESLNVASAAAIIFSEFRRRK